MKDLFKTYLMQPFKLIDHTADVGIKAWGATLIELFENAARGMFAVIGEKGCKAQGSKVKKKINISEDKNSLEEILVSWLSELLYIFNKEKIYFNNFKIASLNNNSIEAEASGANIGLYQTSLCAEIKAVTFHNLKIEKDVNGFSCAIIFDV